MQGESPKEYQLAKEPDIWDELMEQRSQPVKDLIPMPVDEVDPNKVVKIASNLYEEVRQHLTSFLRANIDVFAWSASDMPGIDPKIVVHRLNVDMKYHSIRQKKCNFGPER